MGRSFPDYGVEITFVNVLSETSAGTLFHFAFKNVKNKIKLKKKKKKKKIILPFTRKLRRLLNVRTFQLSLT